MKAFKKLAILCAAFLMTGTIGIATACETLTGFLPQISGVTTESNTDSESTEDESSSTGEKPADKPADKPSDTPSDNPGGTVTPPEDDPSEDVPAANFVYRVKVQNETGYGFKGVTVNLKKDDEVVATKVTTSSGYATFGKSDILELGTYKIEVENIPEGYEFDAPDATLETLAVEGFESYVQINPTGVIMEAAPMGTYYSLGDVMHDFTVKTSDNTTFTLSEVLKEKKLVLINFWATWCGPCKSEFPAMNNAYIQSQEDVATLAISTTDAMSAVKDFKAANGLQFDMTSNSDSGANIAGMFNTSAIPLSVMVDRYGVIVFYHAGSMTAASDFTSRFARFTADNYKPTVIIGAGEEEFPEEEGGGTNFIKPDASLFPNLDDVKFALGNQPEFTYEWDLEEEYAWPWIISTNPDGSAKKAIKAAVQADGNFSSMIVKVNAQPGYTMSFDYKVISEEGCDIFYVVVDGTPVSQISGIKEGTFSYVFSEWETAGEHIIHLMYVKDTSTTLDGEIVEVSNLRMEETSENAQGLVFRHAANVVNDAEDATTYYKHYVDVVLNSEDGYYHVGTEDGPILFANMMLSSRWSNASIWMLAYYDYLIADGYNFRDDIEPFAWEANQPIPGSSLTFGYTPVTQELKNLLDFAAQSEAVRDVGEKFWTGAYHDKEWLEMCAYWQHHDEASRLEDPMKTITFHAAEEMFEGENEANVLFSMTPRGFKYKFTPTKSGVYNIYSTGDLDTTCFLVASDRSTFLGEYTDVIGKLKDDNKTFDMNFYFHYYMEAGETYYLLLTTYLDTACTYPVYIDYVGDSYSYLEAMAVGPYSFNEVSYEMYLPDAKSYEYDSDNDAYYVLNADGTRGGQIYVSMCNITAFFPYNDLYSTANASKNYDVDKRAFYVNGVDYTDTILKYARRASDNYNEIDGVQLEGYIALNKELFEAICAITRSAKYDGLTDSWQMLCYYFRTLGA